MHGAFSVCFKVCRSTMMTAVLTIVVAAGARAQVSSGPVVGFEFDAVPFETGAAIDALFVAWKDSQADVQSGILRLDDGTFTPFPILPVGYVTNLNVGVGGGTLNPRAYVTWVGNQLELVLATFDARRGSWSLFARERVTSRGSGWSCVESTTNGGLLIPLRYLDENENSQQEHECPNCGRPTSGTYAESGTKTAPCEDCFDRQRWDDEGGASTMS